MHITLDDAKKMAIKLKTNIDPKRLLVGMRVEAEHGSSDKRLNVTDDDIEKIAKIALAHFKENPGFPDYYDMLLEMEKKSDAFWKNHTKPNIFKAYDVHKLCCQL